jgi:hypothetical protein
VEFEIEDFGTTAGLAGNGSSCGGGREKNKGEYNVVVEVHLCEALFLSVT